MNKAKIEKYLPELIGKTIEKICYREPESQCSGYAQVIFEFSDGSHFEIYGFGNQFAFTGLLNFQGDEKPLDTIFKKSEIDKKECAIADKNDVTFSIEPKKFISSR
jgi:hypothetical protein